MQTQTFFSIWENHGLKAEPTIGLIETKQIIPDKNLFGQSNFAVNGFNVIIQLSKKTRARQGNSQASQPPITDVDDVKTSHVSVKSMSDIQIPNETVTPTCDKDEESESESEGQADTTYTVNVIAKDNTNDDARSSKP